MGLGVPHYLATAAFSLNIPATRSLQEATLRQMNDLRYRHLFYCAGFVLVGSIGGQVRIHRCDGGIDNVCGIGRRLPGNRN